ncbi:MAG: S46 family peptidase [Bacteroidota bacterium]|nr:S46 family peptidase [Bacteroidota bacterium]
MKKIVTILLSLTLVFNLSLKADEGMWLLQLIQKLNIKDMQEMGCKLSAEDIYSINQSSLKDAIVIFGRGCTGELVSEEGLLLTNHHCGFGQIQAHSTVEHDYLKDGFWAANKKEELPNPGLSVTFLKRIEDVSEKINSEIDEDMSEDERYAIIDSLSTMIEKEATTDNGYMARVQSFFNGNNFYLLVYEVYKDVRLVGTPPNSIGKFGADTDNWMWPRHTADFSMFRVYMSPDGKPAEYAEENIPYEPKHHLPVSIKGVKDGDFTMIMGYPGGTDRYMTSWGVKETMEITNPTRIKVRTLKQDLMMEDMQANPKVKIQYATKFAHSSNYWKYSIGQNKALKTLKVVDEKEAIEADFNEWVNSKKKRRKTYGEALGLIKNAYEKRAEQYQAISFMGEAFFRGGEIIYSSYKTKRLAGMLSDSTISEEMINKAVEQIKEGAKAHYKDYNAPTDKKITTALLELYANNVPEKYHPEIITTIKKEYNNNFKDYTDYLFENSIFASEEKLNSFLENPSAEVLNNDPALLAMNSIISTYREISASYKEYAENLNKGRRLFLAGLMEMQEDRTFYPDANFTMRLTYGQVDDYYPKDAVHYDYFTTLKGVMEKEDPTNFEFVVPEKLKELYKTKDYGRYGDNGVMKVGFISNNDITGGNSGSPIMNGNGELIGLAFDGNWEAMSGDIAFNTNLQRTINVDIRYVLFVIDKFAGASHLVDEMTIVE